MTSDWEFSFYIISANENDEYIQEMDSHTMSVSALPQHVLSTELSYLKHPYGWAHQYQSEA